MTDDLRDWGTGVPVHLAVLGEHQGICGGTQGSFTVSTAACTCEDCLYTQDAADGPLFHDEWGEW